MVMIMTEEGKKLIQQIQEEIRYRDDLQKSKAKKINNLIYKTNAWGKKKMQVVDFNEPILFLTRRSNKVDFYENVTAGMFEFQHSDGEKRFQIVDPSKQISFGFGEYKFKGYVSHEDYPIVGLPEPSITCEQMNIIVDKSLNDLKAWKAKELKAKGDIIWKVLIGIAIVAGVIYLGKTLVPSKETTKTAVIFRLFVLFFE